MILMPDKASSLIEYILTKGFASHNSNFWMSGLTLFKCSNIGYNRAIILKKEYTWVLVLLPVMTCLWNQCNLIFRCVTQQPVPLKTSNTWKMIGSVSFWWTLWSGFFTIQYCRRLSLTISYCCLISISDMH